MKELKYEYEELYDDLDNVVFSAERLGEKISTPETK